jgi:hypothetical protein
MSKNLMIGKTLVGLSMVLLIGACANKKMEMPEPMMAAAQQPAPRLHKWRRRACPQAAIHPPEDGLSPGSRDDFATMSATRFSLP